MLKVTRDWRKTGELEHTLDLGLSEEISEGDISVCKYDTPKRINVEQTADSALVVHSHGMLDRYRIICAFFNKGKFIYESVNGINQLTQFKERLKEALSTRSLSDFRQYLSRQTLPSQ